MNLDYLTPKMRVEFDRLNSDPKLKEFSADVRTRGVLTGFRRSLLMGLKEHAQHMESDTATLLRGITGQEVGAAYATQILTQLKLVEAALED